MYSADEAPPPWPQYVQNHVTLRDVTHVLNTDSCEIHYHLLFILCTDAQCVTCKCIFFYHLIKNFKHTESSRYYCFLFHVCNIWSRWWELKRSYKPPLQYSVSSIYSDPAFIYLQGNCLWNLTDSLRGPIIELLGVPLVEVVTHIPCLSNIGITYLDTWWCLLTIIYVKIMDFFTIINFSIVLTICMFLCCTTFIPK